MKTCNSWQRQILVTTVKISFLTKRKRVMLTLRIPSFEKDRNIHPNDHVNYASHK